MLTVREEIVINVGPDVVWQVMGDFHALDRWLPGATMIGVEGRCIGAVRRFAIGGAVLTEEQVERDDDYRSLTYVLIEGPLPVSDYRVHTSVKPLPEGFACAVWQARFDAAGVAPEKCEAIIRKAFKGSLAALKAHLENGSRGVSGSDASIR